MSTGRNDQCPCGSGKKYKNCCYENKVKENYAGFIDQRVTAVMTTCMVSCMEVLRDEFGFTQEQLQTFAEKYPEALKGNLKVKE